MRDKKQNKGFDFQIKLKNALNQIGIFFIICYNIN